MSKPSSKRKSAADPRPKFDDEDAQERKIASSAANPARKRKKPKPEVEQRDDDLDTDLGAESKRFSHTDDAPIKKKKRKTDLETTPTPKKKKKISTDSLREKAAKKRADLDSEMEEIDSQAEEFADSTWVKTYHVMFRKLRKIMRATEDRVVDSEKAADIYALMALYNQMREVIADLRSMIDLSQNTQRIIDQVLYPLTRDISNNYVDSIYKTMKSLRMHVDGEKYTELKTELEKVMGEHGKYIQAAYEKSSQRLSDLLED